MINYNLYRHYFPLMAIGRARRHFSGLTVDREGDRATSRRGFSKRSTNRSVRPTMLEL